MLGKWWGRKSKAKPRYTTGDRLVYAIGDVHGRADLLRRLMDLILLDVEDRPPAKRPLLIPLGDYVDRGHESRAVIDLILAPAVQSVFEVKALKGNHEAVMLAFLEDPTLGPAWTTHGGAATLLSYGVSPPRAGADEEAWNDVRLALLAALPPAHARFLTQLSLYVTVGDYLFVHAGVRPGVPIEEQTERDLLWIREEFLSAKTPNDRVVVHGHTPQIEPTLTPRRIGVDTGAYATNMLTAVRLAGAERSFLQVGRTG